MLLRLLRAWRRRRLQRQRDIFRFHDGSRPRAVDPLAVWHLLHSNPGYSLDAVEAAECDDPEIASAAAADLHPILCEAFSVDPFDPQTGEGMTIGESLALLDVYLLYVLEVKKKRAPLLTRSQPSAWKSLDEPLNTSSDAALPGTQTESNCDAPAQHSPPFLDLTQGS